VYTYRGGTYRDRDTPRRRRRKKRRRWRRRLDG